MAGGAERLRHADVRREVQGLAVQVGELDVVVVDDPEPPDAGARQVDRHRGAERAGADDQDARVRQPRLRAAAPLGEHELARVALELLAAQRRAHSGAKNGVET